ncbi:uncharacterized protein LOC108095562 [Drosophila ficusphila]|uniref:uncharacterized protein LOC108095562 n=1 Tax=Drosophila ficusphila TaxID=30025 RepID=UPI0007E7238B|nr:uncharacterized protein LOC108095562 [Drosophila ficusphila]
MDSRRMSNHRRDKRKAPGSNDGERPGSDDSGSDSDTSYMERSSKVIPEDPSLLRIVIMADPEVTLGFLLAGVGYQKDRFRSYMMVEAETLQEDIEHFFLTAYRRSNIGIIIVDYETAKRLKNVMQRCHQVLPILITVPNKSSLTTYLDKKERNRRLRQRDAY